MAKAEKREAKLRSFLAKLGAGQNVQNRDLRTWIDADAYADAIIGAGVCSENIKLHDRLFNSNDTFLYFSGKLFVTASI